MAHKAATQSQSLQAAPSFAFAITVLQDNFIFFSSLSTVLRYVVFGPPLFLLPSAVQKMLSLVSQRKDFGLINLILNSYIL